MIQKITYTSPIGVLEIAADEVGITSVLFENQTSNENNISELTNPILNKCANQLDEYFGGKRKIFDIPCSMQGTDFQKQVWEFLLKIPYGITWSYLDLAKKMGDEKLTRAVGNANGKNKISIIVPCHRVIGSNGKLTGYAGELWRKKWLLSFEAKENQGKLFKE